MSGNWFGHSFRFATWGESHGPAIGCVVDGCPPGIALTEADIQPWLDRRKPGAAAGYASTYVPLFVVPGKDGRGSERRMAGSIKGPGAVAEITPRLQKLLGR